MTENEILTLAQNYMKYRRIEVILPGEIGEKEENRIEVIFLNPMTLEPDTIVCPPDYRVWVNLKTKEVDLIYQM
jgi:hypothetical protein